MSSRARRGRKPDANKTTSVPLAGTVAGLVISRFGSEADVRLEDHRTVRCHLRRKLESLVCGDRVRCQTQDDKQAVVVACEPRRSELLRPIRYQGLKAVAANLDRICIVTAPEPEFSAALLDKYLVASELARITPLIVFNKADRLEAYPELPARLKTYANLGYQMVFTSTKTKDGLNQLRRALSSHRSVFVGQSGVGKSSLVNCLIPEVNAEVAAISENSGLGTHTTTASRLYSLPDTGEVIDSPGIREFSLEHVSKEQLQLGYREFLTYSGQCRFRNCNHSHEPGCAVRTAAENGTIQPARYQQYLKLLESLDADG